MSDEKDSYKQIFKATSIFGGVQVVNIIIAIIRSKFVAVLLGPSGMGIVGIFASNIAVITNLTSFGISTSSVKNVAEAYSLGDEDKLGKTLIVLKRLVWGTGLIGFLLTLIFAPWLSKIAFGNYSQTSAFILISISLLLTQLNAGETVVLRGTRKVKYLAISSLLGASIGLFTSLPLYYFFAKDGIVPAIIITSFTALVITTYFSRKITVPKITLPRDVFISEGKNMLKVGFLISLSGLTFSATSFIERIFIGRYGGMEDVGLYVAGFSIIGTYVSLIFTAMSTDYYPRLSSVSGDNIKCKQEINHQAEIAILILAPILIFFLVFVKWAIVLLYSESFIQITSMVQWAALGIFFKAVSWAMSIVLLAKSASKVYFWSEIVTNAYLLSLNLVGYYYWGLTGLGISFFIAYILYFIQVYMIINKLYSFSFSRPFLRIFIQQLSLAIACFLSTLFDNMVVHYGIGITLILISSALSLLELNRRLNFANTIKKFKKVKP
jgi:O-antigen/teichoic acid export membrane protein